MAVSPVSLPSGGLSLILTLRFGPRVFFTLSTALEEEDTVSTVDPEATTLPLWVAVAIHCWGTAILKNMHSLQEKWRMAFCAVINH